jgi:hypothetical protein
MSFFSFYPQDSDGGEIHGFAPTNVQVRDTVENMYSGRDTVRFAYVTSLLVEGKQTHKRQKPKTLPDTVSYKVLPLVNVFVWTVSFFTNCPSHTSDPLSVASKGRGTHGFVPTTATSSF